MKGAALLTIQLIKIILKQILQLLSYSFAGYQEVFILYENRGPVLFASVFNVFKMLRRPQRGGINQPRFQSINNSLSTNGCIKFQNLCFGLKAKYLQGKNLLQHAISCCQVLFKPISHRCISLIQLFPLLTNKCLQVKDQTNFSLL